MFKELNEAIKDCRRQDRGTKPLDKLFDDMDNLKDKFFKDMDKALPKEVTYVSRLEQEVKQLKHIVKGYRFEIATLKKSLSQAGELIESLKQENRNLEGCLDDAEDRLENEIIDILRLKDKLYFLNKLYDYEYLQASELKKEIKKAEDALITSMNENTKLKEELKFKNLPLNKRLEQEYINKRENEDKQKEKV